MFRSNRFQRKANLRDRAVCLLIAFLIALMVNACARKSKQTPISSPDNIAARIQGKEDAAIQGIWSQLKINSELFKSPYKHAYAVERFDVEIDGEAGPDVILRISQDSGSWDWQYLFFTMQDGKWRFLGNIDLQVQKYEAPEHRIISMGGKGIWLAITPQVVTGTGMSLREEVWYKVGEKKPREVLRYPVEGYLVGWDVPSRKFSGKVLKERPEDGIPTVEVEFAVSYSNYGFYDDEDLTALNELFSTKQKVRYVWELSSERFVVDSKESELSQDEIDGIFNDANEQFLKHRFEELAQLATNGSNIHRKWLKRFLGNCKDSPWKDAILERLRSTSDEVNDQ